MLHNSNTLNGDERATLRSQIYRARVSAFRAARSFSLRSLVFNVVHRRSLQRCRGTMIAARHAETTILVRRPSSTFLSSRRPSAVTQRRTRSRACANLLAQWSKTENAARGIKRPLWRAAFDVAYGANNDSFTLRRNTPFTRQILNRLLTHFFF